MYPNPFFMDLNTTFFLSKVILAYLGVNHSFHHLEDPDLCFTYPDFNWSCRFLSDLI